jgi:hypothetical protein
MMDGSLLAVDKVYEAVTTPAKRRKVVVRKRETADPKSIQDARSLGKNLFAEMGPDGEDALFSFLQAKLKGWHVTLSGFRQLADTGSYPGSTEIAEALTLIGPLLADTESRKFIERFNGLKVDLVEVGDQFHELEKQRIVKPADLVAATYLETSVDVDQFLGALRGELEDALAKNERIEIR